MNIVNQLTLRHIKAHKKRSVLTIMAIVVSVAMVTAVFTSALSFVKYFQNVSEAIDGNWHSYVITDDYLSNADEFKTDDIDLIGVNLWYGTADIDGDNETFEMEMYAVDKGFLDLRNVKISEGAMPKSTNEILVHRKFLNDKGLKWRVGDKVTLPIILNEGTVEKEYTIVGITDSNVAETDYTNAFVYATDDYIKSCNEAKVYIRFTEMNTDLYDKTEALADKVMKNSDGSNLRYNYDFLEFNFCSKDGNASIAALGGFCAIILAIIAIVSIFMIYDSFAVSYQERARYLGMLASVGATKKQKRNSIYFEGLILGAIGIPLGIIAGIGGIWVTFKAISGMWIDTLDVEYNEALSVSVNWWIILATILASSLTIFVSSYIPAVKASKTSAIDAIRQTNTVKVKNSKRLRTNRLSAKLIGFEGTMAVKNYKRNGRRSRTIVFALFMSVVVFLSVSNFSMMFNDVMKQTFVESSDLIVSVDYNDKKALQGILDKNSNVDSYFVTLNSNAQIDTDYVKAENKKDIDSVALVFVDNATLDSYLKQLGEDVQKYHKAGKPTGVLHNSMMMIVDNVRTTVHPFENIQGKTLNTKVIETNYDTGEETLKDFSADVGIQTTKDMKNDKFHLQNMSIPMMMLSIDYAEPVLSEFERDVTAEIVCKDAELTEKQILAALDEEDIGYFYNNANSQMQSMNNILIIVEVFVYGFIVLITLISIMNIINTISNSMNERRREFAMIRSVGMTPKSFKRMIYYESFRYGIIALAWAIPISVGIHFGMYKALQESWDFGFKLHPMIYVVAIVASFAIIGIALLYSITKIKDDNIIETLKYDI